MSHEDELIKQLEVSPESEILGVVGAGGASGGRSGPSDDRAPWTLLITLSGWKPVGGSFRDSALVVRKLVSYAVLKRCMGALSSYDVIRVRARWSENNVFRSPQALLTKLIGKDDTDPELIAHARKLQEPVTFADAQFGLLTLDRRVDLYEAKADWCGVSVSLRIPAMTPEEMGKLLETARQLWAAPQKWQRKLAACAVKHLLDLKNETWLAKDEPEVSKAEFARRMVLESVHVLPDGAFEFWYNDGDLFWGHSIMVSGNLTDGPEDAGIHG